MEPSSVVALFLGLVPSAQLAPWWAVAARPSLTPTTPAYTVMAKKEGYLCNHVS